MQQSDPPLSGLVDIHAHVLPGIDDGPPDLTGAIAMARTAADAGISTLVSTPHLRADFPDVHLEELGSRCDRLREALAAAGISLKLVSGAEVSLVWALEATDEELKLATYGQRGDDLLIETPTTNTAGLDRLLYGLRAKGFRVTLAHPERSPEFRQSPELLSELVAQGILLQVNADGLLAESHGSSSRRFAQWLCTEGIAHVIASDGHRAKAWRPVTCLPRAVEAARNLLGPERAEWMARTAPAAIVGGQALPEAPPVRRARARGRLFRHRRL